MDPQYSGFRCVKPSIHVQTGFLVALACEAEPSRVAAQSKYWKCLQGLAAQPSGTRPLLDALSAFGDAPFGAVAGAGFASFGALPAANDAGRQAEEEGGLLSPRSAAGSHSLERSLRRNKLARGQCGKSSRRWHMLQSLHLAVVKSFLKKQRRRRRLRGSGGAPALNGGTDRARGAPDAAEAPEEP